jgi:AcrR family transcriptional regulator
VTEAPARRRNAAATREAILASARRAFARSGYDGAGVREIAKGAGVTAMLVNRYFGSKEELFAEVIADIMATPDILAEGVLRSATPGADMAAVLVEITKAGATPLDGFLVMLHSASSERAAQIGREQLEQHYHRRLTEALSGDLAPERAALVLALVAGVQAMRQVIGLTALADADPATLVRLLTPVFRHLVEGEEP